MTFHGITCPYCGFVGCMSVSNVRQSNGQIWRRRVCGNCGEKITTYERIAEKGVEVIERDKSQRDDTP